MTYVEVFALQYGEVYEQLVDVIEDLSDEALNWRPYAGGNSIAVLVTHTLGNQVETLLAVSQRASNRDRKAEFAVDHATQADLLATVEGARAVLADLAPRITPEQLDAMVRRPAAADSEHPGLYQLNHSITHAREHLGQIWMTRDLWKAKSTA
jgi:uncharacterized damage-inducible protein DinB